MPNTMQPPLQTWFDWLTNTHTKMLDLNNQTSADLVVFANQQAPGDLLINASQQGELSLFLSGVFGVAPPDQAFSASTFRAFVDATVPDRDSDVRHAAYFSAIRNDPSVHNLTQRQFGKKKPSVMFPNIANMNDLFATLIGLVPEGFFPNTPANRTQLGTMIATIATMDTLCGKVLA